MAYKDKEKQKEVTKERVRRYRALQKGVTVTPQHQGVTKALPLLKLTYQEAMICEGGVSPMKETSIPGLKIEGNRIVDVDRQPTAKPAEIVPLYNPAIHKVGDRVRVQKFGKWQTVVIPEIDGDGHPIL